MLEFLEALRAPICNFWRMPSNFSFGGLKQVFYLFIIVFTIGAKVLCYVQELANSFSLLLNSDCMLWAFSVVHLVRGRWLFVSIYHFDFFKKKKRLAPSCCVCVGWFSFCMSYARKINLVYNIYHFCLFKKNYYFKLLNMCKFVLDR